ncbi:tetratricopeptide repeat-containing diguanylate cyclase [Deinococcus sedimenti]|uniref:GGDEF domain-containing protein n=1 Tax=Deinococcus sedimenti TaxID=1867090 RepID=A0ABQ2S497_9DEIO|nr:GGDEF domain-containing protein [Deinococcus sedimenti]GGR95242.1 hypothetical protein GCM10008960_22690 [Deinococcus sedimenti]
MDLHLPAHLHPFEALLPPQPGPQRVDALLSLSGQPHPLAEQVDLAEQARRLASSLNDAERTARAELRLANLQGGPEVLALVQSAGQRFEYLGLGPEELDCAAREAHLLTEPHARITALARAAALADELGARSEEQALRTELGQWLRRQGSGAHAREAFTRALELADAHDHHAEAVDAMLGLGELHLDAGHPAAALETLRAAAHYTHGEGTAAQARALGGLGRTYAAQGDQDRAVRFLDAALTLAERHGDAELLAPLLDARAAVHDAQGEAPAALRLLKRSLALTEHGWPDQHGETLLRLADHARAQGHASEARQDLIWTVTFALDRGRPDLAARAHLALADLAEAQEDHAEAAAHLRAGLDAQDRAGQQRQRAELRVESALRDAQERLTGRRERRRATQLLDGTVQDASGRLAAMQIMLDRWRSSSMLDAESGAHSRQFGLEVLALHHNRCVRMRAPLALAIVGVDVQAPPGLGPADLFVSTVLSTVARVLEGQVRAMDTVARFDQGKFMVIFPETDADGATHPLRRAIEQVRQYDWGVPELPDPVSLAVGVVERGFVQGVNMLVDAADSEHYRAHRAGPNQLTVMR